MKKFIFHFSMLLVLISSAPSFAQMGKMDYPFRSRAQVVPVLKQTRGNLRKTYNALICAARLGYINTAVGYYEAVMTGQEFSSQAQDSAAYAFAIDLASSVRPWDWKKDKDSGGIKKSNRALATLYRDRAFTLRPNSAEVLVMRSFWQTGSMTPGLSHKAYYTALQAVKVAPRWADAHFWLAWAAKHSALAYSDDIRPIVKNLSSKATVVRLGKAEMRAYDVAERLDPSLRPYLYLFRAGACESIADKKSAQMIPIYIDAHLRAFPNYLTWFRQNTGRSESDLRDSYKQIADEIARNATS